MTWAIGEQSVATAVFAGDDHPHLVGLQFSSDDHAAHLCMLTLSCEDGSSYQLTFNRGGAFTTAAKVEAEPPPEEEEAGARSASHKKGSHRSY
jgi:hypothetical protein